MRTRLILLCGLVCLASANGLAQAQESDFFVPEEFWEPTTLRLEAKNERYAKAMALYVLSLLQEESEGPDRALETKRQVLSLDPGFSGLAVSLSHQYLRRGLTADATSILKDAAKANPQDPRSSLALASIYLRQLQKPALAEKYATQALLASPETAASYEVLWDIYQLGQEHKIESLFTRGLRTQSQDPMFWLSLADLRLREQARRGKPLEGADRASFEGLLDRAIKLPDNNARALARIGDYFVLAGMMDRAIPLYASALALRANAAGVRERLAGCYIQVGQPAEAAKLLADIVKENPLDLRAYDQLTQLHLESKDFSRALASMQQALLLAMPDPRRYDEAIRLSFRVEDTKTALSLAKEATNKFPQLVEFTFLHALALSAEKQHEEAMRAFDLTLVTAATARPDLLDADFYFSFGAAADQAGQNVKAAGLLKTSIEMETTNPSKALNYLGYMWADRNENLTEAEQLIRRALEYDPNNGAIRDSLGWVFFRQGNYEAAIVELHRAAEALDEPDSVVYDHIGDTYEALGKVSDAVQYWTKALELDVDNEKLSSKLEKHSARIVKQPPSSLEQGVPPR